MAPKPSHDKLIHCDACGEDYSSTYRRCPFCGERNDPRRAVRDSVPSARDENDQDDTYVFDGQDAFDDDLDDEEYYAPKPKAGKRLAPKQGGHSVDLPPINWPRLITFLCSLVIIVAALIIVFTVIYPQLHGKKNPGPDSSQSQPPASVEPSASLSGTVTLPTAPVDPTPDLPPVDTTPVQPTLTGMTLYGSDGRLAEDFTLWVGESYQLAPKFTPADWAGTVTWTSSNPEWVSVSATGLVANVNNSGAFHNVYITASADGVSVQCVVRAQAQRRDGSTQTPAPVVSNPPAVTTQAPNTTTGPAAGRTGTIVGADGGLRVRPDPSTSNPPIATLLNGNTVTVVADAGNGWYQISFAGSGGATMTGYIRGEYISSN